MNYDDAQVRDSEFRFFECWSVVARMPLSYSYPDLKTGVIILEYSTYFLDLFAITRNG